MVTITLYAKQKKRHRCIEQSFGLCGRRRGWDVLREQHRNMYYLGWNRSPAQVGCMRQVLRPGALGRPRGIGWRGRWEGGSGWGIHVYPRLIHVNIWQKPLQYCKVISLQLIKIKIKKKNPSYNNLRFFSKWRVQIHWEGRRMYIKKTELTKIFVFFLMTQQPWGNVVGRRWEKIYRATQIRLSSPQWGHSSLA